MDHPNGTWGQAEVSDRMRDLLARASADHFDERSSQDAALEEIKQRLEGLEWLLREVRERELGGLTGQLDAMHGRVSELADKPPAWAETLAEHIDRVAQQAAPVSEIPTLRAELGRLDEGMDGLTGRMQSIIDTSQRTLQYTETLADRMEKLQVSMEGAALRFTRIDRTLDGLADRCERIEARLSGVGELITGGLADMNARTEQQLGEVRATLRESVAEAVSGAVQQHLDELRADVEQRLEGLGGVLHTGLDNFGVQVEGLTGRVEALDGRMEGVDGRIDGVDGRLEGVQGRLDGVEGCFTGVDGRLDAVDGRFGQLDGRFEAIAGRFDKIDGHVGAFAARFDKVDGHFDGVHGRFNRLDSHADLAEGSFDKMHGGIGEVGTKFTDLVGKLELLDDRLEALNQRVGQLPVTLDVGDLRKRLTELAQRPAPVDHSDRFDTVEKHLSDHLGAVHARPDREEVEDTIAKIVDSVHDDLAKRLVSLEETVLALAEALLRPAREASAQAVKAKAKAKSAGRAKAETTG